MSMILKLATKGETKCMVAVQKRERKSGGQTGGLATAYKQLGRDAKGRSELEAVDEQSQMSLLVYLSTCHTLERLPSLYKLQCFQPDCDDHGSSRGTQLTSKRNRTENNFMADFG